MHISRQISKRKDYNVEGSWAWSSKFWVLEGKKSSGGRDFLEIFGTRSTTEPFEQPGRSATCEQGEKWRFSCLLEYRAHTGGSGFWVFTVLKFPLEKKGVLLKWRKFLEEKVWKFSVFPKWLDFEFLASSSTTDQSIYIVLPILLLLQLLLLLATATSYRSIRDLVKFSIGPGVRIIDDDGKDVGHRVLEDKTKIDTYSKTNSTFFSKPKYCKNLIGGASENKRTKAQTTVREFSEAHTPLNPSKTRRDKR